MSAPSTPHRRSGGGPGALHYLLNIGELPSHKRQALGDLRDGNSGCSPPGEGVQWAKRGGVKLVRFGVSHLSVGADFGEENRAV